MNLVSLFKITFILLRSDFIFCKQVIIRRPLDKRQDPSESFLLTKPMEIITGVSGQECALKCKDAPGCSSVMLMGEQCVMFEEQQCHPEIPTTVPTTVSTTVSTTPVVSENFTCLFGCL